MAPTSAPALRLRLSDGLFWDRGSNARIASLKRGTTLGGRLAELAGKSVVVATASQLTTALALIELDGVARRLTILPPDADPAHFSALFAGAEIDAVVTDGGTPAHAAFELPIQVECSPTSCRRNRLPTATCETEWVMLTSGTTGVPKLVAHSLAALTAPFKPNSSDAPVVWGTFYDIRRYGGLQIFFRAVLGGASLVLSSAGEPIGEHLERLARHGVTHLSGTPSHWRRALMSPSIRKSRRAMSGSRARSPIRRCWIVCAKPFRRRISGMPMRRPKPASLSKFPTGLRAFRRAYLEEVRDGVELKVVDGSLRIRSPRTATRYVGSDAALADADGFVDTGDILERRGDRYVFAGRRGGIINIGGLKVHPEEIEAVINRHPRVRMSLVRPKSSPITGSIVIADVVLNAGAAPAAAAISSRSRAIS